MATARVERVALQVWRRALVRRERDRAGKGGVDHHRVGGDADDPPLCREVGLHGERFDLQGRLVSEERSAAAVGESSSDRSSYLPMSKYQRAWGMPRSRGSWFKFGPS